MRFRPFFASSLVVPFVLSCHSADPASQQVDPSAGPSAAARLSAAEAALLATATGSNGSLATHGSVVNPNGIGSANQNGAASLAMPLSMPAAGDSGTSALSASWQDDFLQNEQQNLELVKNKAQALASEYVRKGQEHLDRAEIDAALRNFATALDIQPQNQAAREGFVQAKALSGDSNVMAVSLLEDEVAFATVQRAQARIDASQAMAKGDNYRRLLDFDSALDQYRQAELILSLNPMIASDELDRQVLSQKIQNTLDERDQSVNAEDLAEREAAEQARATAEAELSSYRLNQLRETYAAANEAFAREDYQKAEDLADQILTLDPGNKQASSMRDIAQKARFQKTTEEDRRVYREEWQRTIAELEHESLPQTDVITFDLGRWREVVKRQPYEFAQAGANSDPEEERIASVLHSITVAARFSVDGEGTSLEVVRDFLQQVTGINFLISSAVSDLGVVVNLDLSERSVANILDVIVATTEGLAWKIEDGTVKFVTTEETVGDLMFRSYEVRDLVRPPKDFLAPEMNVLPSEGLEYAEEDAREPEATVLTGDDLMSVITANIAADSWDVNGTTVTATETGQLVVYQTAEVHAEIAKLLEELREASGLMVQIQTRFLKVADNFLEDIGIDFRGLGSPGKGDNTFFNDFGTPGGLNDEIGQDTDVGAFYDDGENGDIKGRVENLFDSDLGGDLQNSGGLSFQWTYLNDLQLEMVLRAVSKSERVELVTAPSILVFNTARSNLQVLNQLAYVQDYNVEIATAAAIADPIIEVVQDGVVLDVRPVISADRRFITLDLRPTVASLTRPIAEVSTSLASQGTVTIQLPELELQRMRTVVSVPDGGTLLLGGLKLYEEQNYRSGVPVLNKIPVLSFFFDRKGTYISKQKTLILLRANIVIDEESAPTAAQLGLEPNAALKD